MATLKQRLHRKNSSGSYDVVHLETSSELVKRPDGTTVESSLTELKTSVSSGKSTIAAAVTDKGVQTAADATFATMASNIRSITTLGDGSADATAAASDILSTKTAYVKGSKVTGSMANQGAKTASLNCGGSYTIPAGYHNGSGKITANSLASQTGATATANDIISGMTAWVNGSLVTGTRTVPNIIEGTYTPTSNSTTAIIPDLAGAIKFVLFMIYPKTGSTKKYFTNYNPLLSIYIDTEAPLLLHATLNVSASNTVTLINYSDSTQLGYYFNSSNGTVGRSGTYFYSGIAYRYIRFK